jgi:hypothetical protein
MYNGCPGRNFGNMNPFASIVTLYSLAQVIGKANIIMPAAASFF